MLGAAAALALVFVPLDLARLIWAGWHRWVDGRLTGLIRERERDRARVQPTTPSTPSR